MNEILFQESVKLTENTKFKIKELFEKIDVSKTGFIDFNDVLNFWYCLQFLGIKNIHK